MTNDLSWAEELAEALPEWFCLAQGDDDQETGLIFTIKTLGDLADYYVSDLDPGDPLRHLCGCVAYCYWDDKSLLYAVNSSDWNLCTRKRDAARAWRDQPPEPRAEP